jgi:hypothetical protein
MSLPDHPAYPDFQPMDLDDQLRELTHPHRHGLAEVYDGLLFHVMGARSAQFALPLIEQAIEDKLTSLEAKGLLLFQEGVFSREKLVEYHERRRIGKLLDVRAIQLALTDIPLMLTTQMTPVLRADKVQRTHTSYGLKHHLENYRSRKRNPRQGYITNGDFCMAMLLLGFPVRREGKTKSLKFKCISLVETVKFVYKRSEYTAMIPWELDMD